MADYELPIEAARARVGFSYEERDAASKRLSQAARARAYGLRQAALAIPEALKYRSTERSIARPRSLGRAARLVTRGWILAESLDYLYDQRKEKGHNVFSGLLLDRSSDVYRYGSSNLDTNHRSELRGIDAWGNISRNALKHDEGDMITVCEDIQKIDLKGELRDIDRAVGVVSAPLTLDDLLAGLVVRFGLDIQAEISVPSTK